MAYNRERLEQQAIEEIKKHKLTFFCDLAIYLEPSLSTLYEQELEKSEAIKRELAINRIQAKRKMRNNWVESENPTLQIAAYRLYADSEELSKLTTNKHEVTGKDQGPIQTENKIEWIIKDFTDGNNSQQDV